MKKHKRSLCPIACALDVVGDKWTLLIIRDLLLGRQHFKEFGASPEKIATNILAERLSRLVKNGIAEQFPSKEHLGRDAYRLTAKGRSLQPVINSIVKWGLENIAGTEARMKPK